ncbi:MAG: hypothetical protein ACFB0C_23855 [Leptolyngbyaceae cyanobacterium]
MHFLTIGKYILNLANITYVVQEGDKVIIFFTKSTDVAVKRAGDRLDLSGKEAETLIQALTHRGP